MAYGSSGATNLYASVGAQSGVDSASPTRLIQMLMGGVLDKVALAKGQIQRNEVAQKAESISKAVRIVDGLRMSLDQDVKHQITENLDELYDYMNRRLMQANISNDVAALDEVSSLMRELKEAWDAVTEATPPAGQE